ncbi:transketolase [Aquabacterium sp.]|uniref:transketolase n=1 Tax=Aquabacterium sp. TaxID=1872578 RepID=UPI002D086354|nr:transketolase [Aquabacterium sp.]HSW05544.1 transketolase [Aquabacterium sp.]
MATDVAALGRWRGRREAFAAGEPDSRTDRLAAASTRIRRRILSTIEGAGLGHVGGDLSVTDILVTLFEGVLRIDPAAPDWPLRDRFILSKGHCAAALYAVLAECGYFPAERLVHFAAPLSPLNGHPNRRKVPGVETNTGPLGHGLPVGVGCATAARIRGEDWRTFVVLGDGELQEGSNWEAAMYAAQRRLGNLTAVVDRNRLQQGASTADTNDLEPLADKWRAFGWETHVVDGHSHAELLAVLSQAPGARPRAVIAGTVKGKGVSFMENGVEWHHKVPTAAQVEAAMKELAS